MNLDSRSATKRGEIRPQSVLGQIPPTLYGEQKHSGITGTLPPAMTVR